MAFNEKKYHQGVKLLAEQLYEMITEDCDGHDEDEMDITFQEYSATAHDDIKEAYKELKDNV